VNKTTDNKSFVIAENPRENSSLPYLLSLPLEGSQPIMLATRAPWPADNDLYCHPVDEWPHHPKVVEQCEVNVCRRRGKAIDLILNRRQRRRSIFVWTKNKKGRTLIFWRSASSMKGARPGIRVPQARALRSRLTVAVDTNERYAWRFADHHVRLVERELPAGDYGLFHDSDLIAAIERKKIDDLATASVSGRLTFTLQELAVLPYSAVIVQGRLSDLMEHESVRSGWLLNLVAALQIQFHRVTWMFAETRSIAEDYAYRWLAAAYKAYHYHRAHDAHPKQADQPLEQTRGIPILDAYGRRSTAAAEARMGKIWTSREYAERFDVSRATATSDLKKLVEMGVVQKRGSRRTRHYIPVGDNDGR